MGTQELFSIHRPSKAEATLSSSKKPKGCFPYIPARWVMTILGFLGFFNVYALRVNLSVAMVAMVNHTAIAGDSPHSNDCPVIGPSSNSSSLVNGPFLWGPSTQSWILSSFFIGYIMTQVPGGRLSEMIGPKWLYGGGILTTAVFSLVTPLAAIYGDVWGVVAVRILIGLGEGVTYPAMHVLIARWIPQFERSFKATLIYLGAPIGTVVSSILSGQISGSHDLGWPYVFYIFGLISILWFVLWAILIYGTPEDHPRISLSELDFIKNNTEPPTEKAPKAPWMKLLKSGPLWGLIIAHLGQNCGFYMLLTELPTYMGTILHYDIKQNGLLSSLPYLLQAIVGLVVGRGMDWALKREYISVTKVRKICNSIGFLGPAICLIAVCQAGCLAKLSTAFFCLALAFNGFIYSGYQVVHIDMDPSLAGTLFGITNGVATLGGILSPIYVGFLTESNQTLARWNIIFYTVAGIYVVSNTIFLYIGSAKRQQWESQQDETPPLVGDKSSRDSYNSMGQAPPMEGYNKY